MDIASLEALGFSANIPQEDFVMTTWHDDESLAEALHFAKGDAFHPVLPLPDVWLLHIAPEPRQLELLKAYDAA